MLHLLAMLWLTKVQVGHTDPLLSSDATRSLVHTEHCRASSLFSSVHHGQLFIASAVMGQTHSAPEAAQPAATPCWPSAVVPTRTTDVLMSATSTSTGTSDVSHKLLPRFARIKSGEASSWASSWSQ